MDENQEQRVTTIKQSIERGDYQVDPQEVADAVLRRLGEILSARGEHVSAGQRREADRHSDYQSECSYPDSSPTASVNETPGAPETTLPIQLTRSLLGYLRSPSSSAPRALGGTQTQSS